MIIEKNDFIHKKFVLKKESEKDHLITNVNNAINNQEILFYGLDFNNNTLCLPKYGNTILINGDFDSGKTTLTKLLFSQMMKKNENSINIALDPDKNGIDFNIFENQKTNFLNLSYKRIDDMNPLVYLLEKGFLLNIIVEMGKDEKSNNKLIEFSKKYKKNLNMIFIANSHTKIEHAKVFSGKQYYNSKYPSSNPYLFLFNKDYSSFLNIKNYGLGVYCEQEGLFFSPALKKSKINAYLDDISFTKSLFEYNKKDFTEILKLIKNLKNKENFIKFLY